MQNFDKLIKKSPKNAGVYLFYNSKNQLIYVGKSVNLYKRLNSYLNKKLNLGIKTQKMIDETTNIKWITAESEIDALLVEASLIKKHLPKYNTILKDDKSYLYIKITTGDLVPQVSTARREKTKYGVQLFGPFTSSSSVKRLLKEVRKIFSYCTHRRQQKTCLYVHLGLCPNPYQSEEVRLQYKKDVRKLVMFLKGQKKLLIRNLIKEMNSYSAQLAFEKAGKIKKQIEQIEFITQSFRQPEEYLKRPSLIDDINQERLTKLKQLLNLKKIPSRIECYDISNLGGKNPTGSMVVVTNGVPDKSQYRRFLVRTIYKPDDISMIKEVLTRRFKNDWKLPNLIIIDGGKGQFNAAKSVLSDIKMNVEVIALAKRYEEIHTDPSKEPIRLGKDEPALQIIQQARDEAHRFAISYHRKLRSKQIFS